MKAQVVFFLLMVIPFLNWGIDGDSKGTTTIEKRESILDRHVVIEPELILEIPQVPRWCDRLELKKHRIDVGDAQLYVEEEGKGTPLVLINGGPGGTHHDFHPWFSQAKNYARIIYYDQRGCGLSDFKPGEKGYSVEQAISDLDAIRKTLKIDKWVVLGFSYGGFLAQYYTCTYPEHTAGLILLGAGPGMWTNTGRNRQYQFISNQEKARFKEIDKQLKKINGEKNLPHRQRIQLSIYNKYINGDWKRQHFYKPSLERMAQIALYEWDNDENFNSILNNSLSRIDLTGAFAVNPIPTLILEGEWDLTWGEKKRHILAQNHPHGKMVVFKNTAHGIFDEDPQKFFAVLEDFLRKLPQVAQSDLAAYKTFLQKWNQERLQKKEPQSEDFLDGAGWGKESSQQLVDSYSGSWIAQFKTDTDFLRMGFAFYDLEKYPEALFVFEKMQEFCQDPEQIGDKALALIWQGHMLDLMGKHDQAILRYRQVVEMDITDQYQHGQYGLLLELSPYAAQRINAPFERIENMAEE